MQEFNDIQNLWKQTENREVSAPKIDFGKINSNKDKLLKDLKKQTWMLTLTGIFIIALMILLDEKLQRPTILACMTIIILLCFFQAVFSYINWKKIANIDETSTPENHLKQWQDYNELRKRQTKWNIPAYYFILATSTLVYAYELSKNASTLFFVLAFGGTLVWMIYAYFFIARKKLKQTDEKYDTIINELKNLENQFQ